MQLTEGPNALCNMSHCLHCLLLMSLCATQEGIEEANKEAEGFYIRSGIVTVLRNAEVADGTVL